MRFLILFGKEMRSIRTNPAYNILTVLSPLVFMLVFVFMLAGDITSPTTVHPGPDQSQFARVLATQANPGGQRYFAVEASEVVGTVAHIEVVREPSVAGGVLVGHVEQTFTDINTNMTKNYRNRLTGAIQVWADGQLDGRAITVVESTTHPADIDWSAAFALATVAFGVLFSGTLFGILAMSEEWDAGTMVLFRIAARSTALVVAAKLAAAVTKCVAAGVVLVGAVWAFTGEVPHHWGILLAGLALGYLAMAGLGVLVGLGSRSILTSFLFALVLALVCWVGGGGLGPDRRDRLGAVPGRRLRCDVPARGRACGRVRSQARAPLLRDQAATVRRRPAGGRRHRQDAGLHRRAGPRRPGRSLRHRADHGLRIIGRGEAGRLLPGQSGTAPRVLDDDLGPTAGRRRAGAARRTCGSGAHAGPGPGDHGRLRARPLCRPHPARRRIVARGRRAHLRRSPTGGAEPA